MHVNALSEQLQSELMEVMEKCRVRFQEGRFASSLGQISIRHIVHVVTETLSNYTAGGFERGLIGHKVQHKVPSWIVLC